MFYSVFLAAFLATFTRSEISAGQPRTVNHDGLADSYDFIVIGGGTSGLTVADRLTENPNGEQPASNYRKSSNKRRRLAVTVLVVERGPLDHHEPSVMVPGLLDLATTPYWYNLTSTPQPGLKGGTYQVPAAKVAGGGTVINGMFFDRGSAADYDAWEELGNPGWNWNNLFPYFRKSETFTPAEKTFAGEFDISSSYSAHGFGGPVRASYPVYQFPSISNFLRGWHSMGVETPKDPGAGTAWGAFWGPSSLDPTDETRCSSRVAHYDRVKYRTNYHLVTSTAVARIVFKNKHAVGVDLQGHSGSPKRPILASKEVILAAGIHSPQILQLSGIGSPELLNKHGIETIVNLPGIGQNFQDHPTLYPVFNFTSPIHPTADDLASNKTYASEQLDLYWTRREGAYTITHQAGNVVAFLPLPNMTSNYAAIVDVAKSSIPDSLKQPSLSTYLRGYKAQRSIIAGMYASTNASVQETGFSSGSVVPITLVKPLSRGSIAIKSTNIFDEPAVDFGVFTHPSDLEIMVAALRVNRQQMQTPAMQELKPIEVVPGANVTTDGQIKEALRASMVPTYSHPCCACPMMPRELGGVVDPDLLVYGVEGLSIVDASVMPMIPATHLSATVYAVAEKVGHRYLDLSSTSWLIGIDIRLRISLKQDTCYFDERVA